MLSRLFSGPGPRQGRGHPVTAVGDPNQAIYGWRGASVSNILRFGETSRPPTGRPRCRAYPLTVNRRSDRRILDVANQLAEPLYAAVPAGAAAAGPPKDAWRGPRPGRRPRDLRRRAGLAARARSEVATPTWPTPLLGGDRGADPRQRPRRRRLRRADPAAEIPVEIVGLKGLLRAARGGRGGRDPDPAARPHRQRRAAHPAHRSALGDRPARPGAARRRADELAGPPAGAPARPERARSTRSSPTRSPAPTRPRWPRSPTRSTTRAERGPTPPRRGSGSRCSSEELRRLRAPRRRAAARPGPPDHRHHRHRRRARLVGEPGGAGPARQPRPVRQGGRGVPGGRRRGDA